MKESKQRQIVKILNEIAHEDNIEMYTYADEWIVELKTSIKSIFIYGYKFPNNKASVERICEDKAGLSSILACYGIPVVPHLYYESSYKKKCMNTENNREISELLKNWESIVVKPNCGSGGKQVSRVKSIEGIYRATEEIFATKRACCFTPYRDIWHEYRVVILNGKVQLIYEKIRPFVIGNGYDNITKLIQNQVTAYSKNLENQEIHDIILRKGEKYQLQWKHNLGQGSDAVLINDSKIIKELSKLAYRASDVLDLKFVSIDIIESDVGYEILEINGGIMMEHFSRTSKEYYEIAKRIYRDAVYDAFGY